ncbi:MAG: non-canonical purine NTP pyrophosphatase [Patescibacteria group bacterium]
MKQLLIGTKNSAKFDELSHVLGEYGFDCHTLKDIDIKVDVEETGSTYKENAVLKAKSYAKISNTLTVADDSGLSIDALDGTPGLRSRDLYGQGRNTDEELLAWVKEKMKNVASDNRTAKFVAAVAICNPEGKCNVVESSTEGIITEQVDTKIIPGYPFRSVFYIPKFQKYYSRLTPEEHQQVAHRTLSAKKLSKYFKQYD